MEWSHKLYLKHSTPLIRMLIKIGITANQITIFNLFFTIILGIWFFSRGTWLSYWFALGIMFINVILDYIDGDIAKASGRISKVGIWLDKHGDAITQNAIMAAIAVGTKLPISVIVLFFVSNATLNMVSFYFNITFGFDSYTGNSLFRKYMDKKPTIINKLFKNLIDPTSSAMGLFFGTIRYWIILGVLFNKMPIIFIIITIIITFKAISMYIIYACHLAEYKKLWVLQALSILDNEREEFYKCRILS